MQTEQFLAKVQLLSGELHLLELIEHPRLDSGVKCKLLDVFRDLCLADTISTGE